MCIRDSRLVGGFHGEVLLGNDKWELSGVGVRDHWWGVPDDVSAWRAWASRDGEFIHSDGGRIDTSGGLDINGIVESLPEGDIYPGLRVAGWAPAGGAGRRHARALLVDDRGGGWFEIVR